MRGAASHVTEQGENLRKSEGDRCMEVSWWNGYVGGSVEFFAGDLAEGVEVDIVDCLNKLIEYKL